MQDRSSSNEWQKLCKEYDDTIPTKLANLRNMAEAIETTPSLENLQALRIAVHKLAGNSGMYGYPQVSVLCKQFEAEILAAIEEKKVIESKKYLEELTAKFVRQPQSAETLQQKIRFHQAKIGFIGIGYIGLFWAEIFGRKGFSLIGYDRNPDTIALLQTGKTQYNFMDFPELGGWVRDKKFALSTDPALLQEADIIIVSVSTSLDHHKVPKKEDLCDAFHCIAKYMKSECLVIVESSTYPGTTKEELLPILEADSKLTVGRDFFLAYVPEVVDPGNREHAYLSVPRILGAITPRCLELARFLYEEVGCSTVPCSSTSVAEAAKLLQNTYRLVNITLINEMKIMFDRMGIDIWEVIEAAATKPFGFTPFYPGPGIGGDCIPVVPAYLAWKAAETDGPTTLIDLCMKINSSIPYYVVEKITQALDRKGKTLGQSRILLLGLGYKKDVNDIRESASLKLLFLLYKRAGHIDYHDPYIDKLEHPKDYAELSLKTIELTSEAIASYDMVVIATDHSSYNWKEIAEVSQLIVDTRNVMRDIAGAKDKVIKA